MWCLYVQVVVFHSLLILSKLCLIQPAEVKVTVMITIMCKHLSLDTNSDSRHQKLFGKENQH